jgi:hypothetical protein
MTPPQRNRGSRDKRWRCEAMPITTTLLLTGRRRKAPCLVPACPGRAGSRQREPEWTEASLLAGVQGGLRSRRRSERRGGSPCTGARPCRVRGRQSAESSSRERPRFLVGAGFKPARVPRDNCGRVTDPPYNPGQSTTSAGRFLGLRAPYSCAVTSGGGGQVLGRQRVRAARRRQR